MLMQNADLNKFFSSASFLLSASNPSNLPHPVHKEIMFVGRSNAGKSSIINTLLNQKIARTSRTPGRTQLINFFQLRSLHCFVDCPGYGFAAVNKRIQDSWPLLIDACLKRPNLAGLIWIMDIRHPLKQVDLVIKDQLIMAPCPVYVVLNKADKVNNQNKAQSLRLINESIINWGCGDSFSCGLFSVLKKTGLDKLQQQIYGWLNGG